MKQFIGLNLFIYFLGVLLDHRNWIWCSMQLVCISISAWCMSCDSFTFYPFFTLSLSRMQCCLLLFMLYRKYTGFGCAEHSVKDRRKRLIQSEFGIYFRIMLKFMFCANTTADAVSTGFVYFFYIPLISLFTTHLFSFMLFSVLTRSQSDSFIHVWRHFLIWTRFILRSYFFFSTRVTVLSSSTLVNVCVFIVDDALCR